MAGGIIRRRASATVVLPHGNAGPTPMRKISATIAGTAMRLKNGSPTLTLTPRIASATSGYNVPTSTVSITAVRNRLFNRNTVSRDATPPRLPVVRMRSEFPATRTSVATSTTAMNPRK